MKMKWLKILGVFLAGIAVATAALFGLSRNYEVPECSASPRVSELGQSSEVVTIGEAPLAGASVDPLEGGDSK